MTDEPDPILSPAGRRRRDAILDAALAAGRRRRTRRRATRGTAVLLALAAVVMTGRLIDPRPAPPPALVKVMPAPHPPLPPRPGPPSVPAAPPPVVIERIETDPTIARRLAVQSVPPRWEVLDDAGLVRELAAAGEPAGIVRVNGRVLLLTQSPGER